jgi:hypothetical protein
MVLIDAARSRPQELSLRLTLITSTSKLFTGNKVAVVYPQERIRY